MMPAIVMRLRTEIRSHFVATVALVLLIGVAGGAVLATAAGAGRTDTAFPRFLEASHAGQVLISPQATGLKGFYADIGRLPEVERTGAAAGVFLFYLSPSGQIDPSLVTTFDSVDGRLGYTVDRPRLIEGRLPDPKDPTEGLANRFLAERLHLHAGSKLSLISFREQPPLDQSKVRPSDYVRLTFTITGVGVLPTDVVPVAQLDSLPQLLATPAYFRTYADPNSLAFDGLFVRLKQGATVKRFHQKVDEIASRQLFVDSSDHPILRGLGMTRTELMTLAMLRVILIGVAGAVIAVVVAFLASPIFPIGPARLAETNPGFSANAAILGLGFAGIVLALIAVASYPAWRGATAAAGVLGAGEVRGSERPSRVANATARTSAPPTMSTGLRMALEPGRGRTAVPVQTAFVGLIAAIAAVAAAFTYSTSLNRLVSTPRLYGWNWDMFVDVGFGPIGTPSSIREVSADRSIAALSAGTYGANGSIAIQGRLVPAVGITPIKQEVFPTMVDGRPPFAPEEIVLGRSTLRAAHAKMGDTITVTVNDNPQRMRVVGRAVFPPMGRGSFTPTGLGEGAMLTARSFAPSFVRPDQVYNFILIRLEPGTDRDAFGRRLQAFLATSVPGCSDQVSICFPRPVERPADIANYARVRATPLILAGLLAVIIAAVPGRVASRTQPAAILRTE